MANEPSLGELSNIRVDPEVNRGTPAVNIDISSGLKYLNEAAHAKAQYDWAKYSLYQKNLADNFKALNFDYSETMPEDRAALTSLMQKTLAEVVANPAALGSPAKHPEAYGKIQTLFNEFDSQAKKSKQDAAYLETQNQFLEKHPDLYNEKNTALIKSYRDAGLGRKAFTLNLPITMDIGKMASTALDQIGQPKAPFTRSVYDEFGRYTGNLERVEGGILYDKNKFKQLGEAVYESNQRAAGDPYGHTVKQAAQDQFGMLDKRAQDVLKDKYGDDATRQNFLQSWMGYYKELGGKEVSSRFPDPLAQSKQKLADDLQKMAVKFGYDKILKAMEGDQKMDLEFVKEKKDLEKGKFLNDFVSSLVATAVGGIDPAKAGQRNARVIHDQKTNTDKYYYKAPVSQQIKELFGVETERAGKKTREIPDDIYVSIDGGEIYPIYYKGSSSGTGSRAVDTDKSSTPVSIDDAKAIIAEKLKLTGSLEGASEDLIRRGFGTPTLNAGNALRYIESRSNDAPQKTGERTEVKKTANKTIRRGDIPAKAAAAGYSTKEYETLLKQNGVDIKD